MKIMQTTTLLMMASLSMGTWAAEFSFDRPGSGFGTGITPVGHVAWEQGLPSATYDEQYVDGLKVRTLNLNGNMLLRSGLNEDTELQLGWQGLSWTKTKSAGQTRETDGLGDVSIGVKKAINLKDEQLTMAVLAQVQLATGNPGFSAEDDIYSLSSALAYRYSDLITTAMTSGCSLEGSVKLNWGFALLTQFRTVNVIVLLSLCLQYQAIRKNMQGGF